MNDLVLTSPKGPLAVLSYPMAGGIEGLYSDTYESSNEIGVYLYSCDIDLMLPRVCIFYF